MLDRREAVVGIALPPRLEGEGASGVGEDLSVFLFITFIYKCPDFICGGGFSQFNYLITPSLGLSDFTGTQGAAVVRGRVLRDGAL